MPKYYSIDMRIAALACLSKGERRDDIIKFFGISLKTLSNWIRQDRDSKELIPNKRNTYNKGEVFRERLLKVLESNPDYTLDEFSQELNQHRTTIFYHLQKLNITRKKNYSISGKKREK